MTKHTAGPWQTDETIVFVEGKEEDFAICHTQAKHTNTLPYETSLANARLIATAPELLQALEETVEWMENASFDYSDGTVAHGVDQGEYYGWKGHKELVEKMKNAIAKAKGES